MNQITTEVKEIAQNKLQQYAEYLIADGVDRAALPGKLKLFLESTIHGYYQKEKEKECEIKNILAGIITKINNQKDGSGFDSKAEKIFYEILQKEKIPFEYQVKIGRYRVDYLIDGFLIFEGDGPHHAEQKEKDQARDKYLEKMGYEVIRLTWHVVALCLDETIDSIKKRIEK